LLLRNLKTLAENDGNQHFAGSFIILTSITVLDDMKKLSKQITENYAQTGEQMTKSSNYYFRRHFLQWNADTTRIRDDQ
jgi:hypothetical protein